MHKVLLASVALLALTAGGVSAQRAGDASPEQLLRNAQDALQHHRTAAASEALERAETRLLDRSVVGSAADQPDASPMIENITAARQALGRGDFNGASQQVDQALAAGGGTGMNPAPAASAMPQGGPGMPNNMPDNMRGTEDGALGAGGAAGTAGGMQQPYSGSATPVPAGEPAGTGQ
ncbi:conserved exported protein of unknown function [Rhodovastum atsumiense]|uniref:DUF4148 domain-containing protein n=1 Tax=Rhodovastum atsumiense TaxID=504468 RepID=A0A5M6J052_9PROT|nr:hypothetical protein [Rhodovastum atsumiense]KAA5613005.1 hypothetical protein F1189_06475 [Rhodovastum atsumiense]CAH2600144.1 conserved exported protein of unknown function [Rhodovastum atsumiense]